MITTVIHIKDAPKDWMTNDEYVYIGRDKGSLKGEWGNPFILTSEFQRAFILKEYISYIKVKLNGDFYGHTLKRRILALKGKILVCYCHPLACHGDILALLADSL